jgi:predicted nucleotidyltransferase
LERVTEVLRSHQVLDFAFTGGVAVGVWSAPRQTKDVDVCGSLLRAEVDRLLALRDGIRSGSEELPDIVRFRVGDWDVDLFVSKSPYDRECLSRAIPVEVAGVPARVVTAEDLLIHKMIKLRHDRRRMLQDLADVRAVVDARGAELDWEYIRRWARPDESTWLEEVGRSTDEELVRRLPG